MKHEIDPLSLHQIKTVAEAIVASPMWWVDPIMKTANHPKTTATTYQALAEARLRLERIKPSNNRVELVDVLRMAKVMELSSEKVSRVFARIMLWAVAKQMNLILSDKVKICSQAERFHLEDLKKIYEL